LRNAQSRKRERGDIRGLAHPCAAHVAADRAPGADRVGGAADRVHERDYGFASAARDILPLNGTGWVSLPTGTDATFYGV